MRRYIYLVSIAAACLLGVYWFLSGDVQQQQAKNLEHLKAKYGDKFNVVYALKKISFGEVVSPDAVEERHVEISNSKMDDLVALDQDGLLTSSRMAIGRKAGL